MFGPIEWRNQERKRAHLANKNECNARIDWVGVEIVSSALNYKDIRFNTWNDGYMRFRTNMKLNRTTLVVIDQYEFVIIHKNSILRLKAKL